MVSVQQTTASKSQTAGSSSSWWILLLVKILLVLLILFMLPKLVFANPRRKRQQRNNRQLIRQLRTSCALETCAAYVPEESLNCVFACLSPSCYDRVYGPDPLEDGEVDVARANQFDDCVRDEFLVLSQRKRVEKTLFA